MLERTLCFSNLLHELNELWFLHVYKLVILIFVPINYKCEACSCGLLSLFLRQSAPLQQVLHLNIVSIQKLQLPWKNYKVQQHGYLCHHNFVSSISVKLTNALFQTILKWIYAPWFHLDFPWACFGSILWRPLCKESFTRQGGSTEKMLLSCIMGNVGSCIFFISRPLLHRFWSFLF